MTPEQFIAPQVDVSIQIQFSMSASSIKREAGTVFDDFGFEGTDLVKCLLCSGLKSLLGGLTAFRNRTRQVREQAYKFRLATGPRLPENALKLRSNRPHGDFSQGRDLLQ
jgi:hypothetical protein